VSPEYIFKTPNYKNTKKNVSIFFTWHTKISLKKKIKINLDFHHLEYVYFLGIKFHKINKQTKKLSKNQ